MERGIAGSAVRRIVLQFVSVAVLAAAIFAVVYAFAPDIIPGLTSPPKVVEVEPSPAFVCKARKGDVVMAVFDVKNVASQPVTLLGARSACSCTVAEGLPLKLAPGESGKVTLRVTVGTFDQSGVFAKSADLYANVDGVVPSLVVRVSSADVPKDS